MTTWRRAITATTESAVIIARRGPQVEAGEGREGGGPSLSSVAIAVAHAANRSAARSLALRLRGLVAISSCEGMRAPRVTGRSVALWPHVHTGCEGGQMQ